MWIGIAFVAPIALVLAMNIYNQHFAGMKTRTQGVLIAIVGGMETFDLSFIPRDISTALVTGAAIAALIGYQLSNRGDPEA